MSATRTGAGALGAAGPVSTRAPRPLAAALGIVLLCSGALGAAPASPAVATGPEALARPGSPTRPATAVSYRRPVPDAVVRGFALAAGPYGPGHRGIDLGAGPGDPVRAAARGSVAHAGPVAGRGWVSIDHPDGVRTSYGPLTGLRVAPGERVAAGQRLGVLDRGDHGDGDDGLHFGARRDGAYLDPRLLLAEVGRPALVGPGRVRPADGAVTGPASRSPSHRRARAGPPSTVSPLRRGGPGG